MEVRPDTYAVGIWMCSDNNLDHDWLVLPTEMVIYLYRHGDDKWQAQVSTRTVMDDKVFEESRDKKSITYVTFKDACTEDEARAKIEEFIDVTTNEFGFHVDFQPVYDNFGEWLSRRAKQGTLPKWMHLRVEEVP